ncbi:MAG: nucleoside triphosphate pyrophosphohydrolase [Verrucomicrobiales bacterium]|nr:nucleoside triphosphate pyrophosphohydrolase [Verrucomicrobiales bacterium]
MPHPIPDETLPPMERLLQIMHILRAPGGCPWDAEQTHETLVPHLIEEAYEVAEAVRSGDRDELVDELGDLLLQPVFHAEIAAESGAFDFDDVAAAISDKLIRRHPHVFGDSEAGDADAVLQQWSEIKAAEKGFEDDEPSESDSFLKKANDGLPALLAAQKLQKKVAKVGFDWPDPESVIAKIDEELAEVKRAELEEELAEEIGDLLFAVVNFARKSGFNAELLLAQANSKFVRRFRDMEEALANNGTNLEAASLEEMDVAWNAAK